MQTAVNLDSSNINALFLKYFWPALLSVVIKSVLIMVDSIFIGRGVGPLGLASVGMTMPLQTIFTGLAVMVGVGGAALMSIEFGKGAFESGQQVFHQALYMVVIGALVLVTAGFIWIDSILAALGAEGELLVMVTDYLSIMLLFFVLHALVVVLTVFVINDANPALPMISMFCGALASIGFGYLFIFQLSLGIEGAAYASVLAQIVMLKVLGWHFISGRGRLKFSLKLSGFNRAKEILHIGSPIFLLEVATIVTMLIFNYVLLKQYSEQHMAAYGITMNLGMILLFFLSSIGQACQPILSYCHGQGDRERVKAVLYLGVRYSVLLRGLATVFVLFNSEWLISLYIDEQPIVHLLAVNATDLYFMAAIMLGINLISTTFFQAINQPNIATLISLSRGLSAS